MRIRAYITHKPSEHYADCQDRFCINKDNKTIAISDGMSQSIFPEYWAEILSVHYAKTGHCSEKDRISLCADWMKKVKEYLNEQETQGKNPWRLRNNIATQSGAGATICGIRFENASDWIGDVLGDSCIIEISKTDWKAKIFSSEEKAFDSHPDYYDSFPQKQGRGEIKQFKGSLRNDTVLLLVSDPFSEYIDKYKDNCKSLVEQILRLNSHEDFCKLVCEWRDKGMHNDDSTMCIIEFDGNSEFKILSQDNIQKLIEKEENININPKEQFVVCEISTETNNDKEIIMKEDENYLHQIYKKVIYEFDNIIHRATTKERSNLNHKKQKGSQQSNAYVKIKIIKDCKKRIESYIKSIIEEKGL